MNTTKIISFISCLVFAMIGFTAFTSTAQANERISGTFVKAHYDEIEADNGTAMDVLSKITIQNDTGRSITLSIDRYAALTIDTLPVKIDAFKLGMEIEAEVNLRNIKKLSGKTNTPPAVIETDSKAYSGAVSFINRDLKGFSVKLDDGRQKNVFLDAHTQFFKNGKRSTIGAMREGDRVIIRFSEYDSTYVTKVDVMNGGVIVEGLYKGTLLRIEPSNRKITLRDEKQFTNWYWFDKTPKSNSSYFYSASTPIYLENQLVPHNDLRKYANHRVYIATVKKNGKEQAERIIIQKDAERTYYEPLQRFSATSKMITLQNSGNFRYHDGSILIRNGRLVEPEVLGAYGTAFIAASGPINQQRANIVHISNDALDMPSMAGYAVYFGKVSSVHNYQLNLQEPSMTVHNTWVPQADTTLHFTNQTYGVQDIGGIFTDLTPPQDFRFKPGYYGYFYVKDDQLIGAHFMQNPPFRANSFFAGRLDAISKTDMTVRSVSQWSNGAWTEHGLLHDMDIRQAMIIKDGEAIEAKDLRSNDRLFIIAENKLKARIVIVD